jgi:O-acetyl-ADP-ribose deacetylase
MTNKIEVIEGDITQQNTNAIVNAANQSLLAGGGVSGAIHRAAGLGLEEECIKLGWCEEGEAKITGGYNLPAKWVIHTVGPVWEGGLYQEEQILAQCYRSCFAFVEPYQLKTLAFPAISTGSYEFPADKAAKIAMREADFFLKQNDLLQKVIFVCFERLSYDCYRTALQEISVAELKNETNS